MQPSSSAPAPRNLGSATTKQIDPHHAPPSAPPSPLHPPAPLPFLPFPHEIDLEMYQGVSPPQPHDFSCRFSPGQSVHKQPVHSCRLSPFSCPRFSRLASPPLLPHNPESIPQSPDGSLIVLLPLKKVENSFRRLVVVRTISGVQVNGITPLEIIGLSSSLVSSFLFRGWCSFSVPPLLFLSFFSNPTHRFDFLARHQRQVVYGRGCWDSVKIVRKKESGRKVL